MSDSKRIPVDLMIHAFGPGPGGKTCSECCNITATQYGNRRIYKCRAYGATCSNASDWRKKWPACGMFGKFTLKQVITDASKRAFTKSVNPEQPIDGQMKMEGSDEQQ